MRSCLKYLLEAKTKGRNFAGRTFEEYRVRKRRRQPLRKLLSKTDDVVELLPFPKHEQTTLDRLIARQLQLWI